MSRQYDPYENVVAVMEEAMNMAELTRGCLRSSKIHSERLRFTFLWRWMTEVLRYLKDTESRFKYQRTVQRRYTLSQERITE